MERGRKGGTKAGGRERGRGRGAGEGQRREGARSGEGKGEPGRGVQGGVGKGEQKKGESGAEGRDREGGRQGGREAGRQAGREAGRQAGREAGRQGGRQAGREAGRQGGRQGGMGLCRDKKTAVVQLCQKSCTTAAGRTGRPAWACCKRRINSAQDGPCRARRWSRRPGASAPARRVRRPRWAWSRPRRGAGRFRYACRHAP